MPGQPKNKTKLKILQFELPCRPTRKKRRGRLKNPGSRCHLTESGRVNCQPGQFDEITDQSGAPYFDGERPPPSNVSRRKRIKVSRWSTSLFLLSFLSFSLLTDSLGADTGVEASSQPTSSSLPSFLRRGNPNNPR